MTEWGLRGVVGEHGSKKREEKNQEEESHSWSRNALGSFREVTGASGVHAGWLDGWVRPVQM